MSKPPALPTPGIEGGPNAKACACGHAAQAPVQLAHDHVGGARAALVPRLELHEVEAGVGLRDVREQAEADDRRVALDALGLREDLLDVERDRVGALQRGGVRQLELHEEVALVLVRHERSRQDAADADADHRETREQDHAARRALDRAARDVHVARRHALEEAVEGREEAAERTASTGCFGRSSSAESAGESVSALNAESSTEIAIVTANCW